MTRSLQKRALVLCCLLATGFTVYSGRLVHLQVAMHEVYSAEAARRNVLRVPIYARRGLITDARGEVLAQNQPVKTVIVDGSRVTDFDAVAQILSEKLELPLADVKAKITAKVVSKATGKLEANRYIRVKKAVPERIANEIKDSLVGVSRGVYFEQDSVRVYPNSSMLCHVLGFTNSAGHGLEGIERSMNEHLSGRDGFRYIERDRTGKELVPYRGQERAPENGKTVRLTIDLGLQDIVETEADAAMAQFKPQALVIVLMKPQTGEILAMCNRPNFDPNNIRQDDQDQQRNRAITDMIEPGSTFKIVTLATALTQRLVTPLTSIYCENGYWSAYRLRDHKGYGYLTAHDVMVKSSNIGTAKIAIQLGDDRFHEAVRKFGFGERTGVNLPGEINGKVYLPHQWSKLSMTRMAMGHEVGVTPLQMATAMCAVANGGKLMLPQIVREVVTDDGRVVATYPPQEVRRVASTDAMRQVHKMLVDVCGPKGTASLARVQGFEVAGKTGTSQKLDSNMRYTRGKYVVSFAGYMPAENPEFVAYVMLDEAKTEPGKNYGGLVAAPIFSRIAERAARYLNLTPSPEALFGDVKVSKSKD